MEFCQECGMRLVLTKKTVDDSSYVYLVCPKCSYQRKVDSEETVLQGEEVSKKEPIAVIDRKQANLRTMPKTKSICPKCGNKGAYWWIVQTRGSDESPTQFFRCTKCSHTWREMA